jgi:hypothetical protein
LAVIGIYSLLLANGFSRWLQLASQRTLGLLPTRAGQGAEALTRRDAPSIAAFSGIDSAHFPFIRADWRRRS